MAETAIAEEAERAVIGAMLIDKAGAVRAGLELDVEDFYIEKHREIFRAVADIIEEQSVADPVTVLERLSMTGRLEAAGGREQVLTAVNAVHTAAHLPYYCKIVRQASLERQFDVQVRVIAGDKTPANVAKLDDILMRIHGEGVGNIIDFQTDLTELVEKILEEPAIGYHSGFFHLDNVLNRIESGDLVTIGARTSGGKTAFKVQMMMNMARAGVPVGFMTTEMDEMQLIKRILPMASGVEAFRFRGGKLTDNEKERVRRAVYNDLSKLPIKLYSKPRMSLKDIRGFLTKTGVKVGFFDYLQRAKMPKAESRVYEIEEFMVGLKTLARATKTAIVTAVQLDRGLDKNPTVAPELADLRGSGAIEAESDTVILLWRPPAIVSQKRIDWVEPSPGSIAIEALVKKNRHGPSGVSADFELNGELVQIAERTINKKDKIKEGEEWYK